MKDIPYQKSVQELADDPHYRNIVAAVGRMKPIVPMYDYKGATNIEEIKAGLAQAKLHEAIMNALNPRGKADG